MKLEQRLPSRILLLVAAIVVSACGMASPAFAGVISYTSSADFLAAASGIALTTEDYSSGTAGQLIPSGGAFDGLTYTTAANGVLMGSIISDQFDAFSGLSLGGNESNGTQFFFGGDSVTIAFSTPVNAFGAFFNVNLDSGLYEVNSAAGDAASDSTGYDIDTFVFAGLISDTAFSSVTLTSSDTSLGSFNVPELLFGSTPVHDVPEPLTLSLFAAGVAGVGALRRRRR